MHVLEKETIEDGYVTFVPIKQPNPPQSTTHIINQIQPLTAPSKYL